MKIRRVQIRNVRSIERLEWSLPEGAPGRWHVVIGDNGSGKSSFLRSLALALLGPKEAIAARQDWHTWLRSGTDNGLVLIEILRDPEYDFFSGSGRTWAGEAVAAAIALTKNADSVDLTKRKTTGLTMAPERHIWGTGAGWFSAAYGPFRRFSGGDMDAERSFFANPKLGAHLSVFGENIALHESLYWLRELNYKKLERHPEGRLLEHLSQFVNQDGFLPHNVKLKDISSDGVEFEDANGFRVSVEELSDGYRSILSMTFELIRQLTRLYGPTGIFDEENRRVIPAGVVLIDEIDAHMHPTWQKKIGFWLTEHFPNIQFIVSTHSPLICQAAVDGSIFLLPRPGSSETGRMLDGPQRDRLIYGDILDAYSTEAFGTGDTRSRPSHEMQERLAQLNVKETTTGLSEPERAEQERLRAAFPTSPHSMRGS